MSTIDININEYSDDNIGELIKDLSDNYIVSSQNVTGYILDQPTIINHQNDAIDIIDISFANYELGLNQYSEDQEEMKVLLSKWFIIFIVIVYVTIMNMASSKPMTYMGMLFVITFLTIVSYNIIRNLYLRNKGYNK